MARTHPVQPRTVLIKKGQYAGADPDPNVRLMLRRRRSMTERCRFRRIRRKTDHGTHANARLSVCVPTPRCRRGATNLERVT